MRVVFGREIIDSEMDRVCLAFQTVYTKAFIDPDASRDPKIQCQCSTRPPCGDGFTVAWMSTGEIKLCSTFFTLGNERAASAILEELLHHYAGVPHGGATAVEEANNYQNYLQSYYMS
jgi:hypothetical protein